MGAGPLRPISKHWQGRETMQGAHAGLYRLPLFACRMVPGALKLRVLSPDVILAVEHSHVEGAGPTPGGEPCSSADTIGTFLFVRIAAGWQFAHGDNTTIDAHNTGNDPARRPPR